MDVFMKCVGLAVVGAILTLVTRKHGSEFALLASISVVVAITMLALAFLKPVISFVSDLQTSAMVSSSVLTPVMKTLAIGFLSDTAKNLCDDAGEKTIGSTLQTAGGIASVYVMLPLMSSVLKLVEGLI